MVNLAAFIIAPCFFHVALMQGSLERVLIGGKNGTCMTADIEAVLTKQGYYSHLPEPNRCPLRAPWG